MISIIKIPAKVSPAENSVVFGFKSNNNIISSGTKASLILYFGSIITTGSGYQFSITFGGNTYIFTMAATPDTSGLQFPRAVTDDDTLSWMKKIRDALNANFYISDLYDLTYTHNRVTLTAKYPGAEYNITGANISTYLMSATPTAGTNYVTRPFFKIFAQALMGGVEVAADSLEVDTYGRAYFDLSEYLKPEVSSTFLYPENPSNMMIKRPDMCKMFNVRYAESYQDNGQVVIHKMSDAGVYYALTGGVNKMTEARYNELFTNFYAQMQQNHMFLTWHPGNKKTAQYDIQKLYYLVHTNLISHNTTSVWLKAALKYKLSGSSATTTQVFIKGSIPAAKYDVLELCCGYSRLGLDTEAANLPAGSWVTGYDIFLTDDAGTIISQIFSFELDIRTYMNYRSFIFRNSLGAFETIRCNSVQTREANYENTVLQNYRQWNFGTKSPENKKNQSLETARFIINTGLITESEMNWSRELFMSKEVYEVRDNMLYPVVVTSEKVSLGKDREFLYSVEWEYVHGFTDQHYSIEKNVKVIKPRPVVIHDFPIFSTNNVSQINNAPIIR